MSKFKIFIISFLVLCLGSTTYCAFAKKFERKGTIQTTELSSKFLNDSDFLIKINNLDSSIISIDKNTDLVRSTDVPNINLTNNNVFSTTDSKVPIYVWIDNGTIYYYTIAINIDMNIG